MHPLRFDLSIDPNPRFVSVVRRFVEEAFERMSTDPDAVYRVSMTAHELLENAVKYSLGGRALLRVALEPEADTVRVSLSIVNDTVPLHIVRLKSRIDAIVGSRDRFVHYQDLMRQSVNEPGESGLGLARIAAEGEMGLGLEINGHTIAIIATGHLPKAEVQGAA
jgi:two-component sensor histidine kinase